MRRPQENEGLGWIAEVVMAVATIAHKLYQRKRAKQKVKRAARLDAAEAARVQAEIVKTQAQINAMKAAPLAGRVLSVSTAGPSTGSGKGIALAALGIGALVLLRNRKARR
jgi:MYXO-CTERM domain-containing protein